MQLAGQLVVGRVAGVSQTQWFDDVLGDLGVEVVAGDFPYYLSEDVVVGVRVLGFLIGWYELIRLVRRGLMMSSLVTFSRGLS